MCTACALLSVRGRASLWNGRGLPYGTKVFSNSVSVLSSKAIFPYPCLLHFFPFLFLFSFPWFYFILSPSTRPTLTFFSFFSGPCPDFRFLCVLPFPFQFLAQKSVRCAGILLGQNWNSGRVGEGVKTEDWEALKQNTIVIVLIFISIATLMQCFSLTPGIPLQCLLLGSAWRPARAQGTGRVPLWLWLVGKWMGFEEISSNLLVQLYGLPLRCGTDLIRRFVTKEQKGSCWDGNGSCCSRQQ